MTLLIESHLSYIITKTVIRGFKQIGQSYNKRCFFLFTSKKRNLMIDRFTFYCISNLRVRDMEDINTSILK